MIDNSIKIFIIWLFIQYLIIRIFSATKEVFKALKFPNSKVSKSKDSHILSQSGSNLIDAMGQLDNTEHDIRKSNTTDEVVKANELMEAIDNNISIEEMNKNVNVMRSTVTKLLILLNDLNISYKEVI